MDHLDPAKETGSSTVADLTTKCRPHNLYRARLRYGVAYVQRRIEEERRAREARRALKVTQPVLREPVAVWLADGGSSALAATGPERTLAATG